MRPVSSAVLDLMSVPHGRARLLMVAMETPWLFTDAASNITWGGKTYLGNGRLLDVALAREGGSAESGETTIELADSDRTLAGELSALGYLNRTVQVFDAYINLETLNVVGVVTRFAGNLTEYTELSSADSRRLVLQARWLWAAADRVVGRTSTAGGQAVYFPYDKGLDFVQDLGREHRWGRE